VQSIFVGNHGISWSIYCHDPDGNNLSSSSTPLVLPAAVPDPLDLSKADDTIIAETRKLAQGSPATSPMPTGAPTSPDA
jgi:hypothetical protein